MKDESFPTDPKLENTDLALTLPEAAPGKNIHLLRVDGGQAHFIDSAGKGWYFNSNERLWRPMDVRDVSGMALQMTKQYKPEKTDFSSIEDAARYAMKIHFMDNLEILDMMLKDRKDKPADDWVNKGLREEAEMKEKLIKALDTVEAEEDPEKKEGLVAELEALMKRDEEEIEASYKDEPND